ncbi:MAG TPA: hypothetical protein ENN69_06510 [Spirochaetia bacterium]|nr:hypothetical protein [Spirochaetia bacterium]
MAKEEYKDEILERMWVDTENGTPTRRPRVVEELGVPSECVAELEEEGFITLKGEQLSFTGKGKTKAATLIRSHRLAERLFTDVLELQPEFMEANACTFEHVLSRELDMAICTLLGHPRECPHGKPIPPGDCCKENRREVEKVIFTVNELEAGDRARILYIATRHHTRLDQLLAVGITPRTDIKIHQTSPAYVIQAGETDIALDDEVCRDIYVRKL